MIQRNSRITRILFIVLFSLLFCGGEALAQAQQILVRVSVKNDKDGDKAKARPETVKYRLCISLEEAKKVAAAIDGTLDDNVLRKNKVVRKGTNGRFSATATPGMAIVISAQEGETHVFTVVEGKTEYDEVIEVNRLGDNVTIDGKKQKKPRSVIIDADDGKERFKITIPIDKELVTENSRIILQTYAVDCSSEDTVCNMMPIVYEGDLYHGLQNRRKGFDFLTYDSLGKAYHPNTSLIEEKDNYLIDTLIEYKKKDVKRFYKGPTHYVIEDYHKVYYRNVIGGSCLRLRPFKFLDFSVAIPEMELSQDFYEEPLENFRNESDSLKLKFVQGQAVLTNDSTNEIEKERLLRVLDANKEFLISATIIGTASPEGSDASNKDLARRRALRAKAMVEPYIPRGKTLETDVKLYTWEDVAIRLDIKGKRSEAKAVRDAIAGIENERLQDQAVRKLDFYDDVIKQVLEELRVMRYEYKTYIVKILSPDEVVDEFYNNKQQYLSGQKVFSNGDFFNLFNNLTDSADLDSLTVLAYKKIKRADDYYFDIMAPYVINRMERLNQRNGMADSTTLAAFIDDSLGFNVPKIINGVALKVNRPDIVMTQALTFFQLQEFGRAKGYVQDLKDDGLAPAGMDKLAHFMNIKDYYGKEETLEDAEYDEYEKAKNFILSSSNENKAILFTEIPEWSTPKEAEDYVNLMDDNNPKKWYLKGLLWARRANEHFNYSEPIEEDSTVFQLLTIDQEVDLQEKDKAEYTAYLKRKDELLKSNPDSIKILPPVEHKLELGNDTVTIEGIKPHLAYFHHCFEMQPRYRRYYFNEGHIDEELRKKYPYRKAQFPAYKKLFKLLKKRDDLSRNKQYDQDFAGVRSAYEATLQEETEDNINVGTNDAK